MAALRRERPKARFLKTAGISFLIHIALIAVFSLTPWHTIIQAQPAVYSVTLTSIPLPAPEPVRPIPPPEPKVEKAKAVEKPPPPPPEKKIEKPKKDDIVVKVKKPPKQEEKPLEKEKTPNKSLREALEDVSKKKALDEINKRIASRREPEKKAEERPPVRPSVAPPAPVTPAAPSAPAPRVTAPQSLSRHELDSKLNEYYGLIWAKIKEEWTIPQNLFKEMVDLEVIVVVIIGKDGRIQKCFYDKRSGNPQYDDTAMRAIKKADPLPSIPKELNEDTLEVGCRFTAEDYHKVD